MTMIELASMAAVFTFGLVLGYITSGLVLGPGVLSLLAGLVLGAVLAAMFHRRIER